MPRFPKLLSLAAALAAGLVTDTRVWSAAPGAPPPATPAPRAAPAPVPPAPAPGPRERLLVLQKNAELLSGFDPDTGDRSGAAIRIFAIPHEIAATADGALLFITNYGVRSFREPDRGSNMVTIVDAHRVAHAGSVDLGAYFRPHGIARGRSGRFYVTTGAGRLPRLGASAPARAEERGSLTGTAARRQRARERLRWRRCPAPGPGSPAWWRR